MPATKKWSLAFAGLLIAVALGVTLFFFGRQVQAQLGELARIFPPALEYVLGEFGVDTRSFLEQLPKMIGSGLPQELMGRVASYGMTLISALADLLVVVVAGVFLAADPMLYKHGLVLRGLEQAHRAALDDHVHRPTRLGQWVLISGSWY